jgi:hypothetical protein
MAVNWGLAGQGFDASEVLQSFGQAQDRSLVMQQRALQQQELERRAAIQQQQQQARSMGAQQVASGDFRGATATAFSVGDYDFAKAIGNLQEDKRKELERHSDIIGRVAFGLRNVPADQRRQRLQALAPQLSAYGIDTAELDSADLTDQGLDGYVAISQSVKDALAAQLTETRIADVGLDNQRQDRLASNTVQNTQARLALARNADARGAASNARAAEARREGRVRFQERDKDRAAVAAGGRGVRTDLSDLDY